MATSEGYIHAPSDSVLIASRHYLTELTAITPTAAQNGLSSVLVCRLYRDANAADHDAYGADAGLLEIDFHYSISSLGSQDELTK